MNKLQITDHRKGHVETAWNPADITAEGQAAIAEAERLFRENVTGKRMLAYSVDPVTKEAEQIRAFDPQLQSIVVVPVPQGG